MPASAALSSTQDELNKEGAAVAESSVTLDSTAAMGGLACLFTVIEQEKSRFRSCRRRLLNSAGHSQLLWVQDGVVVNSRSLDIDGPIALSLVLSAAGLKTDLTGLNLVQSPELKERQKLAVELACKQLQKLCEDSRKETGDFFGLKGQMQSGTSTPDSWIGRLVNSFLPTERPPEIAEGRESLQESLQSLPHRLSAALLFQKPGGSSGDPG